jgi:hypothetical protein
MRSRSETLIYSKTRLSSQTTSIGCELCVQQSPIKSAIGALPSHRQQGDQEQPFAARYLNGSSVADLLSVTRGHRMTAPRTKLPIVRKN